MRQPSERRITVEERPRVPWDGAVLGYAAVLPFPVAALAVWFGGPALAEATLPLVKLWGGFLLIFLAGVWRGLSFRTPGESQPAQIAVSLWLFVLGAAALVAPRGLGLMALLAGHATLMLLDPVAARRGEAPLYFARLRPLQMGLAVASLAFVLAGA